MTTQCPKCKAENPDTKQFCGDCGTQLRPAKDIPAQTKTIETPLQELSRGALFANRYEIIEELGAGGMGKVYRVEDKKTKEEIALKLIKPEISAEKKTIDRFKNELITARKIRHQNICGMYDLGEEKGNYYITMEYVSGEDLKSLIRRVGRLDSGTATKIAKQICSGLSEAHRLGVIHRDLKPSNIMIDDEGNARIMDFGIARSLKEKGITGQGVMIGTPEYMSPEQVEASQLDERSDIYSLGIVLYEITTGKLPFEADTPFAVGIKHKSEIPPDPQTFNPKLSDDLRSLILKCLEKDKKERYQNASEIIKELDQIDPITESGVTTLPIKKSITSKEIQVSFRLNKLIIPILCLALGAFLARLLIWKSEPSSSLTVTRTKIDVLPAKQLGGRSIEMRFGFGRPSLTSFAISPDGQTLVYYGLHENDTRLYLRILDQWEGIPLDGTDGAAMPFFSPDGQWIGFWADGQIKKISVQGGLPTTLCSYDGPYGASWGANGKIVLSTPDEITWFPDTGGEQETLISPDRNQGEIEFFTPHVLPGAKALLFSVRKSDSYWENPQIEAYIFQTGERKIVLDKGTDARYSPTGHIIFVRKGTLYAAPFDLDSIEITGEAVPILEDVMHSINARHSGLQTYLGQFAFSESGTLAYIEGGPLPDIKTSLVKVDRNGVVLPLTSADKAYSNPRVSPDGNSLCYFTRGVESEIWRYDFERNMHLPLTYNRGAEFSRPIWTRDGKWLIFYSEFGIFLIPSDHQREPELLYPEDIMICSVSPDGKFAAYISSYWPYDIWVLNLKDKRTEQFTKTPYSELYPDFSPDGRYIAYSSDETDQQEVYIQPFPGPGEKIRVSSAGGFAPSWGPNGQEIFYIRSDSMILVDLTSRFLPKNEKKLFDISGKRLRLGGVPIRSYDVTKDGQYFVAVRNEEMETTPVTQINIIHNWFKELKRIVPTK